MRYIPNSAEGQQKMLQEIGLNSLEDLLKGIPASIRLRSPLKIPSAMSEAEILHQFRSYEQQNSPVLSFLGAGVNDHYIPTVIDALISRGEFLTSYTPYQAEISQGTLQAIFEFQTFICQLTDMEISNASMYDGSTALAEAVLMAARISQRTRFLLASSVHPEYRAVVNTYMQHQKLQVDLIGFQDDGRVNGTELEARMGPDVAAIVVQSPNFFGNIESLAKLADLAHRHGSLLIVAVAEALSLGILNPPGAAGADIVCGECQSLGIPASFGGPHAGFLATRGTFVRNLPGRLAGQTVDAEGKRGFVLTLSTREQHIRREKATSNICTNQSLFALMATIYCSLLGKKGIRKVAAQNVAKTQYAVSELKKVPGLTIRFSGPRFNEVVVHLASSLKQLLTKSYNAKIAPGLPLERYFPDLGDCLLISFTETKSKQDIDKLITMLGTV
jgi:glycine dehydrogenase subunit 1